jgi:hypothetical protein
VPAVHEGADAAPTKGGGGCCLLIRGHGVCFSFGLGFSDGCFCFGDGVGGGGFCCSDAGWWAFVNLCFFAFFGCNGSFGLSFSDGRAFAFLASLSV